MIDRNATEAARKVNWQIQSTGLGVSKGKDESNYTKDFPEHAITGTFSAAERQALNARLRKSSLPSGYEKMPTTTNADAMRFDEKDIQTN